MLGRVVYKLNKNMGRTDFSDQIKKVIKNATSVLTKTKMWCDSLHA